MTETSHYQIEAPPVTIEKRWLAARRLAAGDGPHVAAARAGLHEDSVLWMSRHDPGFAELVAAAQRLAARDTQMRQALLGGKVALLFASGACHSAVLSANGAVRLDEAANDDMPAGGPIPA